MRQSPASLPVVLKTEVNALYPQIGPRERDDWIGRVGRDERRAAGLRSVEVRDAGSVDVAVDYTKQNWEDTVHDVDLALLPVGGETMRRTYDVMKKGGTIATLISRADPAELEKRGIRGAPVFSHPDANELTEITKLIDAGKIKPIVSQVLGLTDAAKADAQAETHHTRGKIVVKIADEPKT